MAIYALGFGEGINNMAVTISRQPENKIIGIADKIMLYGLPILYFLISIAFYLRTYDSAQIKITLIQIGGTILVAAWLIKLIEENGWSFYKKNMAVVLPLLAFLVSGIISYIYSPFTYASGNELIRRVFYMCMALIAIKEFNSEDKLRRLFGWLMFATFVATLYGVVQYLDTRYFPRPPEPGLDPFIWRFAFGGRIFSTFGNPNFFGDFLVVMSPLVLALFIKKRRFFLIVAWLLIAFNTYHTGSKGAWLGFGAGLAAFTFLSIAFFLPAKNEKIKKFILITLFVSLLLVGYNIYTALMGRTDSASFRLFTWISTFEMIKTNPVIGTGIGSFYVTYPAWRRPQIFYIEGRHNTETDHPENEYLEVWYDEGIIGIGIFLWLLSAFLLAGFRNLRTLSKTTDKTKNDLRPYYLLGLLTALIAQLAHNTVCVSLRFVSSGIFLWLLVGLIGAISIHYPSPQLPDNTEPPRLPPFFKRGAQYLVAAVAVYFIIMFYGFFQADINHNMAIFYSKQGQWPQALDYYTTVTKQNPSFIMSHYFMGNVYNDRWTEGDAERSIEKYNDVWKLAPNYVQSHHQAGLIFLKWGEDEKRKADEARRSGDNKSAEEHDKKKLELWNRALSEFERYRNIDPIFPLNYYRMAWVYMQLGQPEKAEEMYLAHLEFPEKLKQPPHNAWVEDWAPRRGSEYAETSMNIGNIRFMRNDLDGAFKYYELALRLDPKSVSAMKNLAVVYGRRGKMQEATDMWNKVRAIAPNDPDVQKVFGLSRN